MDSQEGRFYVNSALSVQVVHAAVLLLHVARFILTMLFMLLALALAMNEPPAPTQETQPMPCSTRTADAAMRVHV